jgi:hypothetical protein
MSASLGVLRSIFIALIDMARNFATVLSWHTEYRRDFTT